MIDEEEVYEENRGLSVGQCRAVMVNIRDCGCLLCFLLCFLKTLKLESDVNK